MTLEEYLISKKIDPVAFRAGEPERWNEWESLLQQMSAASFTAQKLYLINPIRRKYHLKDSPPPVPEKQQEPVPPVTGESPKPKVSKPVFKPKIS